MIACAWIYRSVWALAAGQVLSSTVGLVLSHWMFPRPRRAARLDPRVHAGARAVRSLAAAEHGSLVRDHAERPSLGREGAFRRRARRLQHRLLRAAVRRRGRGAGESQRSVPGVLPSGRGRRDRSSGSRSRRSARPSCCSQSRCSAWSRCTATGSSSRCTTSATTRRAGCCACWLAVRCSRARTRTPCRLLLALGDPYRRFLALLGSAILFVVSILLGAALFGGPGLVFGVAAAPALAYPVGPGPGPTRHVDREGGPARVRGRGGRDCSC